MGPALQTDDRDDRFAALANEGCRDALAALRATPEATTTLDGLVGASRHGTSTGTAVTAARLHHVTLPRLDDVGLVDYDPLERRVRYRANERTEARLDAVDEGGR